MVVTLVGLIAGPAQAGPDPLIVYSGRNENLVGPIIERFSEVTGIEVKVRYGETAELAATILEEGQNSPADVYFAQDAGALGALAVEGRLHRLPEALLDRVEPRFRSPDGLWVGITGRARVVAYNTDQVSQAELPVSIWEFTDPKWRGRIGWAPLNGSFQAFITTLRVTQGEARAEAWLRAIRGNRPKVYRNNTAIVDALGRGEIAVGFVNHYYLYRFIAERSESFPVANYYLKGGDPGALINVAGVAIVDTSDRIEITERFIAFLLSEEAQRYFAEQTYEYPLAAGMEVDPRLVPLDEIQTPEIDLSDLEDLRGTLRLLQKVGVL
ncbi:MAG: iron ABC transporter substrate-binding protein [Candidatus Bipolaricaulia bacterium]